MASASLALAQYLAGLIAISISTTVFQNGLGPALMKYAPEVDLKINVDAGATGLASVVFIEELPAVLRAYNEALAKVFYIPATTAAVAFLLQFWIPMGEDRGGSDEREDWPRDREE